MNKTLVVLLWLAPVYSYAELTCHIHPPGIDYKKEIASQLIGPFNNQSECEQENQRRFKSQGRCHCTFTGVKMQFGYPGLDSETDKNIPLP